MTYVIAGFGALVLEAEVLSWHRTLRHLERRLCRILADVGADVRVQPPDSDRPTL